jgi:hypothetical protein
MHSADVQVLTLSKGKKTTGQRSRPVPQLTWFLHFLTFSAFFPARLVTG